MFSVVYITASLALAHVAVANPVARATCDPALNGAEISIANGNMEFGYANAAALSVTTAEFIGMISDELTGLGLKEAKFAAGLFATLVNGTLELETQLAPGDGPQGWDFVCSTCTDPSTVGAGGVMASSCNIINSVTEQCLQMGSAAGAPVTIANCANLGSGPQYFDIYLA
ncbi:hypothetical protein B0H13DRAFT_1993348 [Mycena leptocephala]|nr:hypothetical protein B0H13DRAFT_1993348 [Mycena leptocephala]